MAQPRKKNNVTSRNLVCINTEKSSPPTYDLTASVNNVKSAPIHVIRLKPHKYMIILKCDFKNKYTIINFILKNRVQLNIGITVLHTLQNVCHVMQRIRLKYNKTGFTAKQV